MLFRFSTIHKHISRPLGRCRPLEYVLPGREVCFAPIAHERTFNSKQEPRDMPGALSF